MNILEKIRTKCHNFDIFFDWIYRMSQTFCTWLCFVVVGCWWILSLSFRITWLVLAWSYDWHIWWPDTVYPKKYAHSFCFDVLCCGYTLTDFPISIRLTSLALWQSNDCPSASKATLMNMDKYFMWIHYERLHNHNKAKHNKTVCIFLGIYCIWPSYVSIIWSCQNQSMIMMIIMKKPWRL